MREIGKISEGLFEKIRDRFEDVSLGDAEANAVTDPTKARFFNFDYTVDGKNYGNITISMVDEISLKVYFSKNITQNLDTVEKQKWYGFLKELREFSKRNMLSFEPRDITRPTLKHRDIKQVSKADDTFNKDDVLAEDIADIDARIDNLRDAIKHETPRRHPDDADDTVQYARHNKKIAGYKAELKALMAKKTLKEGHMYGTNRTSYENGNNVRIMVRHSDVIDPERRGARSRKIKSIFLETSQGERFKLPHNSLGYARAMARHIAEGGEMHDDFGKHISNIAEECSKLRPFRAAMSRRVFEDDETQRMVEAAFDYHGQLKHTLSKMAGAKGYKQCKEEFEINGAYISEEDVDVESIRERFVKRVFNDRMEDALPIVQKAYNMKKENKYAKQFESWANDIAEGTWSVPDSDESIEELKKLLSEELPLGVDAVNATSALYNIIGDDVLFDQLGDLSDENPDADARPVVLDWLKNNMPEVFSQVANSEEYESGLDNFFNGVDTHDEDLGMGADNEGNAVEPEEYIPEEYDDDYGDEDEDDDDFDEDEYEAMMMGWKRLPPQMARGTSNIGSLSSNFDPSAIFGKPDRNGADGKTTQSWVINLLNVGRNGEIVTIYDYKGAKWHVGGKNSWAANKAYDELQRIIKNYQPVNEDEWDDADDSVNSIVSAITNRILRRHTDLLTKVGPEKLMQLIQDEAEYAAPVQEIGSSDVSAWIKNIYQSAGMDSQLAEDSNKPFGLRYKMFAGREERIVTKERWFATEEQRERFAEKIQNDGKFYEIDSYGSLGEDVDDYHKAERERMQSPRELAKLSKRMQDEKWERERNNTEQPTAKSALDSIFGGDAKELTKNLKIKENDDDNGDEKVWGVRIRNNYYAGKYYDYSSHSYPVLATSADEAIQLVLAHADEVLAHLMTKRLHSGKKLVSPSHPVKITKREVIDAKPMSISTSKPIKMLTAQGFADVELSGGKRTDGAVDSTMAEIRKLAGL